MTQQDYERIERSYNAVMHDLSAHTIAAATLTLVRVIERERLTMESSEKCHYRLVEVIANVHSPQYRDGLALCAMLEYRKPKSENHGQAPEFVPVAAQRNL